MTMITPSDSPSSPQHYAEVAVQQMNIAAPLDDLSGVFGAANALGGEGFLYPQGPRQAQAQVLLESPAGFASGGYDVNAGYSGGGGGSWPNDVEPVTDGP